MNAVESAITSYKPLSTSALTVEQQNTILNIQQSILEMVIDKTSASEIFDKLCLLAQNLLNNSVATIMLKQLDGSLNVRSAPNVPPEGVDQLNGLAPGPGGGSCGNAVYKNEPQYVVDIAIDPRCDNTRETLQDFGLCACWSHPIRDARKNAIGSFALSSFQVREPSEFHQQLLTVCAHLTSMILQRDEQDQQMAFLAYNDVLTRLPNRLSLYKEIEKAIDAADQYHSSFSLLYFDLDRFKNINDTFGHQVGDEVLVALAARLQNTFIAPEEILTRFGGDEFVLLIPGNSSTAAIEHRAALLLHKIREPIIYKTHRFLIDGSVGIAQYPDQGQTAEELIKHSDIAMYHAKKYSSSNFCFYRQELSTKAEQAFNIENQLHTALAKNEFKLHFQPQIDIHSGRISGVEALVRWYPTDGNTISPTDFIPIAEETGLIVPISEWIVSETLRLMEPVVNQRVDPLKISINLSGVQLIVGELEHIITMINNSTIPNDRIELEITETVMVQEAESTSSQLSKLHAAGIQLAIDDFGSGYSSLGYLKQFKVNTLKIDRMLVQDIDTATDHLAITKAAIAMGKTMGLHIVIEGVETESQYQLLRTLGCDSIQGFYFYRPVPLEELMDNLI